MAVSRKTPRAQLYAVVESQQGFFTARQAVSAGFDRRNHTYHVSRGNWVREARGIYRLSQLPRTPESDYSLWSLWSMGESTSPVGVFSHETALSIHKLSDVLPAKVHMTVPKDFGSRETPEVLNLHRADLTHADVESRSGYRVTTVIRTLLDLTEAQTMSPDLLEQAVFQALERGSLTIGHVESDASLRKHLAGIRQYQNAEPVYKLLKMFIKPSGMPIQEYEKAMRKSAVLFQEGITALGKWLTTPRPDSASRKSLKRGLKVYPKDEQEKGRDSSPPGHAGS